MNNNGDNENKKGSNPRDEDADAEEVAVAEGEGEEGGEEGVNTENESLNNDHGSGGGGGDNHCRSNESSSSNGNRLCGLDTRYPSIRLPTKRYDGGMNAQDRQLLHQMEVDVGSADPTSTTATAANDSFQTFSNIDTRMRELLGLGPVANPNDADQQEDWRQLTGFLGLGGRRGQRGGNNGNQENNAAVEAEAQQEQQQVADPDQGGNDGGTSPERRTRLSWELHLSAYMSMWDQRGELELPVPEPDREPEPEPDNNDDGHEEDERRDIGRR